MQIFLFKQEEFKQNASYGICGSGFQAESETFGMDTWNRFILWQFLMSIKQLRESDDFQCPFLCSRTGFTLALLAING